MSLKHLLMQSETRNLKCRQLKTHQGDDQLTEMVNLALQRSNPLII